MLRPERDARPVLRRKSPRPRQLGPLTNFVNCPALSDQWLGVSTPGNVKLLQSPGRAGGLPILFTVYLMKRSSRLFSALHEAEYWIDEFRLAALRPAFCHIVSMYFWSKEDSWRSVLASHISLRLHCRLNVTDGRNFALLTLLKGIERLGDEAGDLRGVFGAVEASITRPVWRVFRLLNEKGDGWAVRHIHALVDESGKRPRPVGD